MKKTLMRLLTLIVPAALGACSTTEPPPSQAMAEAPTPQLASSVGAAPLRLVQTIPLLGVEGRFDHFAIDLNRQYLFIAALGNDTLEVLDLRNRKRLRSIRGLQKPTGIAFAPEFSRIFAASGDSGKCDIFEASSGSRDALRLVQSVTSLPDADNVQYDSAAKRVYVGYGDGAIGIVNAQNGQHLGDIKLAGHPESFQLEKAGARLFVNVPTAGHIAVVDRNQRTVIATWPLQSARSNFPMALDEAHHRLFVGCRDPARVLVYDTASGRVTTTLKIAGDTDDLFYDVALKRLYVACGAGFINVFQQQNADLYTPIASIGTAVGARTALFVPELKRLYLAVPHRGIQGAQIRVYTVQP